MESIFIYFISLCLSIALINKYVGEDGWCLGLWLGGLVAIYLLGIGYALGNTYLLIVIPYVVWIIFTLLDD